MSARGGPVIGSMVPLRNSNETVFASTSRAAATYTSDDIPNQSGRYAHLVINITDVGAGPGTLVVTLKGKDSVSSAVYTILASATLNATGTTVLKVGPSLTASANAIANDIVPATLQVTAVVATNAVTFSVGLSLIG